MIHCELVFWHNPRNCYLLIGFVPVCQCTILCFKVAFLQKISCFLSQRSFSTKGLHVSCNSWFPCQASEPSLFEVDDRRIIPRGFQRHHGWFHHAIMWVFLFTGCMQFLIFGANGLQCSQHFQCHLSLCLLLWFCNWAPSESPVSWTSTPGDGFPTFCPANNSNQTTPLQSLGSTSLWTPRWPHTPGGICFDFIILILNARMRKKSMG